MSDTYEWLARALIEGQIGERRADYAVLARKLRDENRESMLPDDRLVLEVNLRLFEGDPFATLHIPVTREGELVPERASLHRYVP